MNTFRGVRAICNVLLFVFGSVLLFSSAPVQSEDFDQDPMFLQIQELYSALDKDMSHFRDLKYDFDNLLWQIQDMNLPGHYTAMEAYRETLALGALDTNAILEMQQKNNGKLTALDLTPKTKPGCPVFPGNEASSLFHETINALTHSNSENPFIVLFLKEAEFQARLAESYAALQSAQKRFEQSAPAIENAIDNKLSEHQSYLAAVLVILSYHTAQNSRAITYYEKYETLIGSIREPDIIETVYSAAIHAFTVAGNFEKVSQLKLLLSSMHGNETNVAAKMMDESMVYDMMGSSNSSMDEVYFYEEPVPSESNRQIHLAVTNISQIQVEDLSAALWNLPGLLDISMDSFSENKASITLTVSDLEAAALASFLNETQFHGFIVKAVAKNETDVAADALGIALEQFNVLAPLFEYIVIPDSMNNIPAAAAYTRSIRDAYSMAGESDAFRDIVMGTLEAVLERAAGNTAFFHARQQPGPAATEQFPRIAMLFYGAAGLAFADTGDFANAFSHFQEARNWIPGEDPQPFAADTTIRNFLALSIQTDNGGKGLHESTGEQIDSAIQAAKNDEIRLRLGIIKGNYLYKTGQYEQALKEFEQSQKLANAFANMSGPGIYATLGMGNSAIMLNQHDQAETAFSDAANKAQDAGNLLLAAMALSHLGRVRLFQGDYPGANESATRALVIADQFALDSLKWESLYTQARALEAQNKLNQALEAYLKSIDFLESSLSAASGPITPGMDAEEIYRYAVALCARMDRTETALQLLERGRAHSLKLEYDKSRVSFHDPEKQRSAQALTSLKTDITGLQMQIQQQAAAPPESRSEDKINDLKQQLQDTQRNYIKYVTELERSNPELASLYKIEPVELVKIRKLLPEDMAVVYYLIGDQSLYIFFVRADRLGYRQVAIDEDTLTTQIKLMRSIISKPGMGESGDNSTDMRLERFRKGSMRLYDILFKPIVQELDGINRIAVLPNGILNFVPFQALVPSDGSADYLIRQYTLFYLDTLAAMNNPAPSQWRIETPLFAFGNADDTLPDAELEVDTLKKMFRNANVFLRGEATEWEAKKRSGDSGVFHFATHGILNFKDISQSYIVLAPTPAEQEDGHFTIEEVWGYWWGDSVLVSLSACSTALGELTVRGKAVHPASAFLNAGAPSVLATLWNVDDAATSRLMQGFYENLTTMEKALALREAQLDLLKNSSTANPYYWAPFTLIGDWR